MRLQSRLTQIDAEKLITKSRRLAKRLVKIMRQHANCGATTGISYKPMYSDDGKLLYQSPCETPEYRGCMDECAQLYSNAKRELDAVNDELEANGFHYSQTDHEWQPPKE